MSSLKLPQLPPILSKLSLFALVAALPLAAGCGNSNSQANFNAGTKEHTDPNWLQTAHVAAAKKDINGCVECHGNTLTGGLTPTGGIASVSCMSQNPINGLSCHATSPANNPTGCKSCHNSPPSGITAPNRAAAHTKHLDMSDVSCATCHTGAGTGTKNHARGTNTVPAIAAKFKAKTAPKFGFDMKNNTCAGISCHGGVETPTWNTGKIDVAKDCLTCHTQGFEQGSPQYNSFWSGNTMAYGGLSNLHEVHIGVIDALNKDNNIDAVACVSCHNSKTQTKDHFPKIYNSDAAAVPAASTIGGAGTRITAYTPFDTNVPSGNCTSVCHNDRSWKNH